jgi:hypothetical protein
LISRIRRELGKQNPEFYTEPRCIIHQHSLCGESWISNMLRKLLPTSFHLVELIIASFHHFFVSNWCWFPIEVNRCLGGTYCFSLQGRRVSRESRQRTFCLLVFPSTSLILKKGVVRSFETFVPYTRMSSCYIALHLRRLYLRTRIRYVPQHHMGNQDRGDMNN